MRPFDRHAILGRELRRQPAPGDSDNAYERHKRFMAEYQSRYASSAAPAAAPARSPAVSEYEIAHRHSRFLWRDGAESEKLVWEERVAKKYYDRLFKEYAIADLSQFEHGQIGLRWRTEAEVVDGKGQFVCANRKCSELDGLCSYEVNFCYAERGESHSALVKLRVCARCALLLNHQKAHARAPSASESTARRDAERQQKRKRPDADSIPSIPEGGHAPDEPQGPQELATYLRSLLK